MIYYAATLGILFAMLTLNTVIIWRMSLGELGLADVAYKNLLMTFVMFALLVLLTGVLCSRRITRPLREFMAAR